MSPKDVFGIIVRTIGLLVLLCGIWFFAFGLAQFAGASEETLPTEDYLFGGALWIVVGAGVIRSAPAIERIAYR